MNVGAVFWDVIPYVTIAILLVGTWWRYRYDKFGWTTRSSQLYESRLLRIGSPLFHFGILVVIFGHIIGLVIPESWTSASWGKYVRSRWNSVSTPNASASTRSSRTSANASSVSIQRDVSGASMSTTACPRP